jgi:hypothetical protein
MSVEFQRFEPAAAPRISVGTSCRVGNAMFVISHVQWHLPGRMRRNGQVNYLIYLGLVTCGGVNFLMP